MNNMSKLGNIEIDIKKVKKPYIHFLISAPEIIQSKRGALGLGAGNVMGNTEMRINRRMTNRQLIKEYMDDMSTDGWEYKGIILYEGLPSNGALIFRRQATDEEGIKIKEEQIELTFIKEFEKETGFNAIWRGKETKKYIEWKEQKGYVPPVE